MEKGGKHTKVVDTVRFSVSVTQASFRRAILTLQETHSLAFTALPRVTREDQCQSPVFVLSVELELDGD